MADLFQPLFNELFTAPTAEFDSALGTGGGSAPRIYPLYPNQIPGVDYPVGRTSTNTLKIPGNGTGGTTAAPAGVTFAFLPRIVFTANNGELVDWDLRGCYVDQNSAYTGNKIEQCLLDNSALDVGGKNVSYVIYHSGEVIVRYNTFTGIPSPDQGTAFIGGYPGSSNSVATIEYNDFINAGQSIIYFYGGTVRYNRGLGVGYLRSIPLETNPSLVPHGNCVFIQRINVAGSKIYENYFSELPCPDPTLRWSYPIYCSSYAGDAALGCEVYDNLLCFGSYSMQAGDIRYKDQSGKNIDNMNLHDNWCDLGHANTAGWLNPTYIGGTVGTNYDAITGQAFTLPPATSADLTATILTVDSVQLAFADIPGATAYEYSYSATNSWAGNPAWTALAGNKQVSFTNASTMYFRVRAYKMGAAVDKQSRVYGAASNMALPASAHSSQATAFLARTSGLDTKHTNAYYDLIDGLVSDGVWAKLDLLYVFATQDSTTALLNLISSSYTATASGAPTFTPDTGFTTASGKFIDTNWVFSVDGVNYTQNAASIFAWSGSNVAATGNARLLASAAAFNGSVSLQPRNASDQAQLQINDTSPIGTPTNSDGTGLYVGVRTNSTTKQIWKNNAQLGSDITRASVALQAVSLQTGGNNAVANNAYAGIVKAMGAGGALTGTDIDNLYTRLTNYFAAIV